ncbi:MAG: 2-oxo-4-hydroxy-4-carboxy-5-ureidoimidazoline decarboxylase [Rhodobacteraceae bacterium]|nr:2-oxo-4-hydroxy-4-carboxy-5-ureidoimidazoline decarboxylase [Paracoccaceae bacterium]
MTTKTSREAFVAKFGGVYEFSPWIAERLFDQGENAPASPVDVAGPMAAVVESQPMELQLTLLRAQPDLGERIAVAGLPEEQGNFGLEYCSQHQFDAFLSLNKQYREAFGFPYIVVVRDRTRQQLLDEFRKRIEHDRATEFRNALNQLHQIARIRLEAMT